jgi:hypothetical protein
MFALNPLYSQLEPVKEQIRVFEIDATEPQIVCRLVKVSLSEDPSFAALSYTWADSSRREAIFVNGFSISVTKNLACTIRSVCYQWIHGDRPRQPRRLWADAICINQADVKEKEHQIPLMRAIYMTASEVFVWLGTSIEKLQQAFSGIGTIAVAEATCSQLVDPASVDERDPARKAFLQQFKRT